MRTRIAMIVLLGLSLGLQAGCASIAVRATKSGRLAKGVLYPATRTDLGMGFWSLACVVAPDPCVGPPRALGLAVLPVAVMDLPISLATDTALLPIDLYSALRHDKDIDSRVQSQ